MDHQILLNKLKNYGIRYSALLWVKIYLHNRRQFVFHNSKVSEQKIIVNSVPQGSILGPLLFNLYINDLKNAVNNLKLVLYADDSCFYYSKDNLDTLIDVINTELVGVNDWLLSNRLTLNLTKSHFLIFSRRRFLQNNIAPIRINNQTINKLNQTEFLGFILQDNLKWDSHISRLVNKINKFNSILFLTRQHFDIRTLTLLYNSLIYSNLAYGTVIWGKTSIKNIQNLFISQKKIIRTIKFRNKFHHTNQDFIDMRILKINELHEYFSGIFVYKILNNLMYPNNYLDHAVNQNTTYSLRNSLDLRPHFSSSSQGQSSPKYYCTQI